MMLSHRPDLEEELRGAGLRVTNQRIKVFQIITESEKHVSAEDIYAEARGHDGSVSLATVYRTLGALTDAGLIEPHYLGPDHHHERYERASKEQHFHFTCARCQKVIEFDSSHLENLREELERKRGWALDQICICLEGICQDCRGDAA